MTPRAMQFLSPSVYLIAAIIEVQTPPAMHCDEPLLIGHRGGVAISGFVLGTDLRPLTPDP